MDSEKILARMVQIGTVSDVDTANRMARVILRETGHTSGWLKVLQHYAADMYIEPDAEHSHDIADGGSSGTYPAHDHSPGSYLTWWMPKVNDQVLVLYLPVFNGDGFVLGGI